MLNDTQDINIKIIDFGLSADLKLHQTLSDTNQKFGTLIYMPPEQALKKPYNHRVDIWAAGIILF